MNIDGRQVLYKTFTVAIISRPPKFAILGFSGGEMPMLIIILFASEHLVHCLKRV